MLGALADNGGPTLTMLPGTGSAAIDPSPAATSCGPADQRGFTSPQGPCDIGAVEIQPANDTDGDGVVNADDQCPEGRGPGTDTDGDGCKDAGEDDDDDADNIADGSDNCPAGDTGTGNDPDGNGCKDDDNDGVLDGADSCLNGATGTGNDLDGDGCKDSEDQDDDNDSVLDASDNCQLAANGDQADVDGDGVGDACDPVDDRAPAATCTVPKIKRGSPLRATKQALRAAGCTAGRLTRKHSRTVKRRKLIRLKAKVGTVLESGAAVDIVVSSGPRPNA